MIIGIQCPNYHGLSFQSQINNMNIGNIIPNIHAKFQGYQHKAGERNIESQWVARSINSKILPFWLAAALAVSRDKWC